MVTHKKVLNIPANEMAELQNILKENKLLSNYHEGNCIQIYNVNFGDGYHAQFQFINKLPLKIDAYLFHNGGTACRIEPRSVIPGEYLFDLGAVVYHIDVA